MNDIIKVSWNTNFTMIPNSLWDLPELSHEAFRVFTYLIRLGAKEEEASFPSYPTIAEKCQLINGKKSFCKTKARRVIEELQSIGLVNKLNRKNKKTGVFGSNLYTLTHPDALIKSTKSKFLEDWDIISDTPCVTPKISEPKKPNKINGKKSDTPCVKPVVTNNIEVLKGEITNSDTYKDLVTKDLNNKTTTTTSGGDLLELIKTAIGKKPHWKTMKSIEKNTTLEEATNIIEFYNNNKAAMNWKIGALLDMLKTNAKYDIPKTTTITKNKSVEDLYQEVKNADSSFFPIAYDKRSDMFKQLLKENNIDTKGDLAQKRLKDIKIYYDVA